MLTYASVKNFNSFWDKYKKALLDCEFEYPIKESYDIEVDFADMRVFKTIHIRNERKVCINHIGIKMHI